MNIVSNMAVFSSQREIFDLPVCDLGWSDAFTFVNALAEMPVGQTVVSFLNAHNANTMLKDAKYRDALRRHLVLPDGVGIDLASLATHGSQFPANLNGTDFVPALMTYMTLPKRIGLLGARPDILAKAASNFKAHAPWHEIIPIHHGYFHEDQSQDILAEVSRHKLDILLVAMGTPRQEKWIDRFIRPEHARLVIGVGALFDFVAGAVPRAPNIVRKLRVEWFYRFLQEPRRLAGRYFVGGPLFMAHVASHAAKCLVARGHSGLKSLPQQSLAPAPQPGERDFRRPD